MLVIIGDEIKLINTNKTQKFDVANTEISNYIQVVPVPTENQIIDETLKDFSSINIKMNCLFICFPAIPTSMR